MNKNWYNILLHFMLVAFGLIIILLVKQNNELRASQSEVSQIENLKKGDTVKNINIIDSDSVNQSIDFKGAKKASLLYFFSVSCKHCKKNITPWGDLYKDYKNKINIFPVCLDEIELTKNYATVNKVTYPYYSVNEENFQSRFRIFAAPQTMLIDSNSTVINTWIGELDAKDLAEIHLQLNKLQKK